MSTTATPISPAEDDLADSLRKLRIQHPSTGAAKLLPFLLEANPTWTVSEKRVRKILQREGLAAPTNASAASFTAIALQDDSSFPKSQIVASIDTAKWTKKVRVADFGLRKGKGLVAAETILENESVWIEDPILTSPETLA